MYTRRGDDGETSLFGPRRVPKDDARVEAYGTIDELNSAIGVAISVSKHASIRKPLTELQKLLFVAGADAANESKSGPRITPKDTKKLEEMTDELLSSLPTLRNFILPGGTELAAQLQFARSVCRRAERRLVTAGKTQTMNPELKPFFNRLSSYLFNLSRKANSLSGKKDVPWNGRPD